MDKCVGVLCGAYPDMRPAYAACAKDLGLEIARNELTLLCDGLNSGLSADMINAALNTGGKVVGVIQKDLSISRTLHSGLAEVHIVNNLRERNQMYFDMSDLIIFLPGGFDTLNGIFGLMSLIGDAGFSKPFGFLNVEGFFDSLISQMDLMESEGFSHAYTDRLKVATEAQTLLNLLRFPKV